MENVHLVVHHRINSLQNEMYWEIMSCCVYHQPSILKFWVVVYLDWQMCERTRQFLVFRTIQSLIECFYRSHESHVCLRLYSRTVFSDTEVVLLFFCLEYTLQLWVFDADGYVVLWVFGIVRGLDLIDIEIEGFTPEVLELIVL